MRAVFFKPEIERCSENGSTTGCSAAAGVAAGDSTRKGISLAQAVLRAGEREAAAPLGRHVDRIRSSSHKQGP